MTPRPRHPKPDSNQAQIIRDLRRLGFVVHDVSSLGGDCLDLFVCGYTNEQGAQAWVQIEVKTDTGKLTEAEAEYIVQADLEGVPVLVARCTEDVLRWFARW